MDWIHIEPEIQSYTLTEKAVLSMLNEGKSHFQIAVKLHVSFEHVREIVFDIRKKESIIMGKLTDQQKAEIYQKWKDGQAPKALATEYNVSDQSIYNLVNKMNAQNPAELEDVENGIPNTPLASAKTDEKSEIAEENSTISEQEKIPHVIWVALDDQVSAINWEIEQREQRIAELKEELVQLEDKRYAIEQWLEAHT